MIDEGHIDKMDKHMPESVWLQYNYGWNSVEQVIDGHGFKYTRANPEKDRVMGRMAEVVKAVAHIGIDFGYGKHELQPEIIDLARKLYEENE